MKIVINTCFGGFGLSVAAIERIAELQGRKCYWFQFNGFQLVPLDTLTESALLAKAYDVPNPTELWPHYGTPWHEQTPEQKAEGNAFYEAHRINDFDRDRANPLLVQVVEELGEKANTMFSDLKIVEIPDDVEWELDEYDGKESIHEKHRTWN